MESLSIYSSLSYRNVSAAKTLTFKYTCYYICVRYKIVINVETISTDELKFLGFGGIVSQLKKVDCSSRVPGFDSQASI